MEEKKRELGDRVIREVDEDKPGENESLAA